MNRKRPSIAVISEVDDYEPVALRTRSKTRRQLGMSGHAGAARVSVERVSNSGQPSDDILRRMHVLAENLPASLPFGIRTTITARNGGTTGSTSLNVQMDRAGTSTGRTNAIPEGLINSQVYHIHSPDDFIRLMRSSDMASVELVRLFRYADGFFVKSVGINKEDLANIPTKRFTRAVDNGQPSCVICMCIFKLRQVLRILPCSHMYHRNCIDTWFKDNNTCPLCRQKPVKPNGIGINATQA